MNCTRLHLCRIASHFSNKPPEKCHFPHKLSDNANNVMLLQRYNYHELNEDLLLNLLRLHYTMNQEQVKKINRYFSLFDEKSFPFLVSY